MSVPRSVTCLKVLIEMKQKSICEDYVTSLAVVLSSVSSAEMTDPYVIIGNTTAIAMYIQRRFQAVYPIFTY